jgi:hypothetical protein
VSVNAADILADANGTGTVAGGTALDCKRGGCGRVKYRRKALGLDVWALGVCEVVDMCDAMIDEDAPADNGGAVAEWTFCSAVKPQEAPGNPFLPDVVNVSSPAVRIEGIYPQQAWNPATCFWIAAGPSTTDCRTLIEVTYTYSDTFQYPAFTDSGFCDQYEATYNTGFIGWRCYYNRRVAPGQFFAEGRYALVRCEYPGAIQTLQAVGTTCNVPGGTICSTDGLTPITPPTLWKPPQYVNLVRLG